MEEMALGFDAGGCELQLSSRLFTSLLLRIVIGYIGEQKDKLNR
jgi:hypothetical protein